MEIMFDPEGQPTHLTLTIDGTRLVSYARQLLRTVEE